MRSFSKIIGMVAVGAAFTVAAAPVCNTADLIHRWSFNGTLEDSVGGLTATASGNTAFNSPSDPTAIRLYGTGHGTASVNLGGGIVPASGGPITIEIWATQHTEQNWSRIFDFGPDNQNYVLMSWTQGSYLRSDAVEVKASNTTLLRADHELQPYDFDVPYHISLTLVQTSDGRATLAWAKRDTLTGEVLRSGRNTTSAAWSIANIANWTSCYLGRSQFEADFDADATYDEVRIWKTALTDEQLTWSARLGPDQLPTSEASPTSTLTLTSENGQVRVNGATAYGSGNVSVSRTSDATLTAVPGAGFAFVRWTGDTDRILSGTVRSTEITVNTVRDFALTAEFESKDNVVYARYENGAFVYLTPGKAVGNAPQGGMNEGITILFSSDEEYRQLCTVPNEVAKAKGLELGDEVKLTGSADWTALDYSLAGHSIDLSGWRLTTRSLNGGGGSGTDELIVNGGFDSDPVASGAQVAMTPKDWNASGYVYLIKDNVDNGYSNRDGSNWLYLESGGSVQQQFSTDMGGVCALTFKVASRDDETQWRNSSCRIEVDGTTIHDAYTGTWNSRAMSYQVPVNPGSHTIKISCNGGSAILVDTVSMKLASAGANIVAQDNLIGNGDFQADYVMNGASTAMIPTSWMGSGGVNVLKNDKENGYSNCNGSNWLRLTSGAEVQQQFTTHVDGNCELRFKVASYDNETKWKDSCCLIQIDGNTIHDAYTGTWNASVKSYKVHVNAGTHTIRVACTGGNAVLVDDLSLSTPGEVVVDVPAGETLVNENVYFHGTGLKVVKSGAGTLQQQASGHTHVGGMVVSEGQLALGNNQCLSSAGEVIVDPNGVLELNGKGDLQAYRFVLNGGTLQNTAADVGEGIAQITSLRLMADSVFKPSNSYGLIGSGYGATTLDLAGHTLTVETAADKSFWLFNATVTAGTLEVTGDGWLVADKTGVNAAAADLRANCALDVRVPFKVGCYEALYSGTRNAGDEPITIQCSFKPHSSIYHGVKLADENLIDLSVCQGMLKTPGLLTTGAHEIIFPGPREYTPVAWIESSGEQWIDTGYVCKSNTRIEATINTCTRSQSWGVFFGVTGNDSASDGVLLRYYEETTTLNGWFCNASYDEAQVADLQGQDVSVVLAANTMTLNGVAKTISTSGTPYAAPLYLFCGNNGGAAWRHQAMRLYSMKISEGGVLVRDFVPCRDNDGVLGLWDRVEGKFYVNKGTGTFATAEESGYTPVAYRKDTKVFVELHGRHLDRTKIIGWPSIPANVIFQPTEATLGDHYVLEVHPNGLYVPRNTVIYFR